SSYSSGSASTPRSLSRFARYPRLVARFSSSREVSMLIRPSQIPNSSSRRHMNPRNSGWSRVLPTLTSTVLPVPSTSAASSISSSTTCRRALPGERSENKDPGPPLRRAGVHAQARSGLLLRRHLPRHLRLFLRLDARLLRRLPQLLL